MRLSKCNNKEKTLIELLTNNNNVDEFNVCKVS